jgi:hypothetical protein
MSRAPYERRIGQRTETHPPIELEWAVGPGVEVSPSSSSTGRLLDISVTGAAIEAPTSAALLPGAAVTVRYRDHEGQVTVADSPNIGLSLYGVSFAGMSDELRDEFYTIVAGDRPDQALHRVWTRTF